MEECYSNNNYYRLVDDIINDNEFKKTNKCIHHGISRFDHSCRVSYYSYKVTKLMRLNYKEVARAGLLHDFFLAENNTKKEKFKSMFVHSKKSLKNSQELFDLSEREKDIIFTHMFPLNINRVPKYMESWIVSIVDKIVAIYEFGCTFRRNLLLKHQNALLISIIIMGRII